MSIRVDDVLRADLSSRDTKTVIYALEELAHRATAAKEPLVLDCGDSSCRSPTRERGGMRTNGGCRCSIVEVAVQHVRMALALIDSPAGRREVRTGSVR